MVLAEHYAPMRAPSCVELYVTDRPDASRRFALGNSIGCSRLDASADVPAVRITTTTAVLKHLLVCSTTFDERSAEIAALGGIRVEGAQRIAAYWFQLLKRPAPEVSAALERARAREQPALREVDIIDVRDTPAWPQRIVTSILEGAPLLARGAIDWPEVDWTLSEWCERDGATVLRGDPRTGRVQTLKDMIGALDETRARLSPVSNYTGGSPVPPAWKERFRVPGFAAALFGAAQLWFGKLSEETLVTNLHCDINNSFLAQVHGSKRVRLFPPREACNVYALDVFNTYRPCRVDADAPDLARFPRFARARYVDVTIHAGDLLVIPTGWFHCVWAKGATMSISRFAADASIESHAHASKHGASVSLAWMA
ncbi:cupin-like domain-containing protein [Trinickia acidisoli]|uniref:cupin-like domain-containing protein n=1 Tax=Trinickia acidisoli TaxID=2767482 RepID=UPI001A8CA340|nr:cupin-like domain-containing protein [Trinickia acidisoli]